MASFQRIEVWTNVSCDASAVRVATFEPDQLVSAVLKQSLSNVEQLAFTVSRTDLGAAELIHGRIARVCYSDSALDTEWRISDDQNQSGVSDKGQLGVIAQALSLDLARAPYVAFDSAGRPTFNFSATQLTATQWLTNSVLPCITEAGLYTVTVGTVEFTNAFDLTGDFANALEIIRAIQQPGRAPGDFVFRRNGATDYKLDLLASRGSTANVVRVQTARNLLESVRKRTLLSLGTKIVPRGSTNSAVRDLSQTYFRVKTVVSGTVATLEDPYGGPGPIGFTDQLKNLYVAPIVSTFASQIITASDPATQNITVASTAGWTGGTTLVRFFRTSTSAGQRVVSLSHPTRVLSPALGGYGPVTRILDMPTSVGDANLVKNPWMRTWTTGANAPDGWGRNTTYGAWTREATIIKNGPYSQKLDTGAAAGQGVLTQVYSPTATPFAIAGLRYAASAWIQFTAVSAALARYARIRIMKPDLSVSYADGALLDPVTNIGNWMQLTVSNVDLSAAAAGVVVLVEISVNNAPNGFASFVAYVDSVTLGEADVPLNDVEYNGGIAMWQRANVLLATISTPIAGYAIQLADLARMDNSAWADEPLVLGGSIEVNDTDLNEVTTQRVVDLEQNLLHPLIATIQLQTTDPLLTTQLAGAVTAGSTISGSTGNVAITVAAQKQTTVADYGIVDAYTKPQVDALLAKYQALAGAQGAGAPFTIGGVTYSAAGTRQSMNTGLPGATFYVPTGNSIELLEVFGYDATSGADCFVDLIAITPLIGPTVGVIFSANMAGAPRARTYTATAGNVKIALGGAVGDTYNLVISVRKAVVG